MEKRSSFTAQSQRGNTSRGAPHNRSQSCAKMSDFGIAQTKNTYSICKYWPCHCEIYCITSGIDDKINKKTQVHSGSLQHLLFARKMTPDLFQNNSLLWEIFSQSTFQELRFIRELNHNHQKYRRRPVKVGNQCDLEENKVVTQEQGLQLAKKFNNCHLRGFSEDPKEYGCNL